MIVKRVHVKNFRSIRDVKVEVGSQLAIVGGNGSGKSSILRAMERFFGQSTAVEPDDFFGRKATDPIEIGLTFTSFSDEERQNFASRIHNNEMTVVRVFEPNGGRNNGRYYGETLQHLAFSGIRSAVGANPIRDAYNVLRSQGVPYETLPPVTRADQIPPALVDWEALHPELCQVSRDDGQFLGFTNVASGSLRKATSFVFIPAVRDASADALDSRGAVIARLLELVVRSAIQRRSDVQKFQKRISSEYRELTDPEKLKELGGLSADLSTTLQLFYREAAVLLKWRAADEFSIPLPTAEVFLDDDGFEGPVDRKGHGLQRAFILTLLQHLAKATSVDTAREPQSENGDEVINSASDDGADEVAQETPSMPGLILAIEEPELYQHPTKQRHFAKVLSQLSTGELPGVARQTQVMFATHSSLFVATDRFNEISLAHRRPVAGTPYKECYLTWSTLAHVARRLEIAYGKNEGTFTADGLKPRLHIINSEIAEGFFAEAVVLVEGASDRAAILAEAKLDNVDFEALGVAILPVDGKPNMDRPAAIFSSLEIPLFIIWDCDRGAGEIGGLMQNRALQRIMGVPGEDVFDAKTTISTSFACFDTTLEDVLKSELGPDLYLQQLEVIKKKYSIKKNDDAEKAPFAMAELLAGAGDAGKRSDTLQAIVAAIVKLRNPNIATVSTEGEGSDGI